MSLNLDIFDADAAISGEGLISGGAGIGGRAGIELSAALCHGLDLAARAEARAQINAALALVVPAIHGQGDAYARAGVQAHLRLDPNLFGRFGLRAGAGAFAEAGVQGRLGIGLELQAVADLAASELPDLPYQLFLIFLEEITPEGGVWGLASVSAMARAHVAIDGSLVAVDGHDPGFRFSFGAAVGLEAGAGYGFYCGTDFDDVTRFYRRSVDLLVAEVRRGLADALPPNAQPLIELFDLALPIALETAYELGRRAAQGSLGSAQAAVVPFLDSFSRQLQRWLLEKIVRYAAQELGMLFQQHGMHASLTLTGAERQAVRSEIEALIDLLDRPVLRPADLPLIIGRCLTLLDALGLDVAPLRRPLALMWTGASLGFALRGVLASWQGSAGGSLFGIGDTVSGGGVFLPQAPALVLEDYGATLNRVVVNVGFDDAVDYLVATGVGPLLERYLPEARTAISELSTLLQATPGELVDSVLRLSVDADFSRTVLYTRWREWLRTAVDEYVINEVIAAARNNAGTGALRDDVRLYVDHVAEPSLRLLEDFIFDQLDRFVAGRRLLTDDLEEIATACSVVIYHILARNLVTFDHIVSRHVLAAISDGFTGLEARFRDRPDDQLVTLMIGLASQSLPGQPALAERHRPAVQELLVELAAAGRVAFGPTIWTAARLAQLRDRRLEVLLSIDGDVKYDGDADAFRTSLKKLAECTYIPNLDACIALMSLQLDILGEEFGVVVERVIPALAEFYLRITLEQVEELDRQVGQFIDNLVWLAAEAARVVNELLAAAEELRARADQELERAEAILGGLAGELGYPDRRQAIRDRLRLQGIDNVLAALAGAPDAARATAVLGFLVAFDNPLTQGLLDAALATIGTVTGDLRVVLSGARDRAEAVAQLGDAFVSEAVAAIPGGELVAGTLSASDVGQAIKDVLLTSHVRDQIEEWLAAIDAEQAARDQEEAKRREAEQEQVRLAEQTRLLEEARVRDQLQIRVLSPTPMGQSLAGGWVYPAEVPIYVVLAGAVSRSFVMDSAGRRVRLALNGRAVSTPSSDWALDEASSELILQKTFRANTHPLQAGTNILEVSIVDGNGTSQRVAVVFAVNPDQPAVSGPLTVRTDLSRFNAPLDDHRALDQEYVVLEWAGDTPLPVRGWRVQDAGNKHRYEFPDLDVPPHRTIKIVTGGAPDADTSTEFHMGEPQAVWNNPGDAVYVIDERGVLRAFAAYGSMAGDQP